MVKADCRVLTVVMLVGGVLGRTAGPLADHPARARAERARIIEHILELNAAMAEIPE